MTAARRQSFKLFPGVSLDTEEHSEGTDVTLVAGAGAVDAVLGRWRGLVAKCLRAEVCADESGYSASVNVLGYTAQLNLRDPHPTRNWCFAAILDWGTGPDVRLALNVGGPMERNHVDVDLRDIVFGAPQIQTTILASSVVEVQLPEGRRTVHFSWERTRHIRRWQPAALEPDWIHLVMQPEGVWWPSAAYGDQCYELSVPVRADPHTFRPDPAAAVQMFRARVIYDRMRHAGTELPPAEWLAATGHTTVDAYVEDADVVGEPPTPNN